MKYLQVSEDVSNFIDKAKSYCSFIENYKSKNAKEFLLVLQYSLLSLYQAGLNLPEVSLKENGDFEEKIDDDCLKRVIAFIADRLEEKRYYIHLFNPVNVDDKEEMYGDLLDDICDIYIDIKQALLVLDIGTDTAMENAAWQFKFSFDNHWGDHCINAIYVTHYFFKNDDC